MYNAENRMTQAWGGTTNGSITTTTQMGSNGKKASSRFPNGANPCLFFVAVQPCICFEII
jgi:hypothetical protein